MDKNTSDFEIQRRGLGDIDPEKTARLRTTDCPRRYCWWWRSIYPRWDLPVAEGCKFTESKTFPPGWPDTDKPCCRAIPNSGADHFEPHELYAEHEGVDWKRFWGSYPDLEYPPLKAPYES